MDSHLIDMNGRLGFKKRLPYNYKGGHNAYAANFRNIDNY